MLRRKGRSELGRTGAEKGEEEGKKVRRNAGERVGRRKTEGRSRVTATREQRQRYRAISAQLRAEERDRRPKRTKLAADRGCVPGCRIGSNSGGARKRSPAGCRWTSPTMSEMRISHETIYRALYVQGRGELRRELAAACAPGGRCANPAAGSAPAEPIDHSDMVMICERPAEAADRAVPGHWEGDLIIGEASASRSAPWSNAAPGTPCCCTCRTGPGRGSPRRHGRLHHHPARAAAPIADLGPGQGDDPAPRSASPPTCRSLLRPGQPLATRQQREHHGCCASTSPKAPTCPPPPNTWPRRRRTQRRPANLTGHRETT